MERGGGVRGVDEGMVQDLARVVQAVAQLREHQAVGVVQRDEVPELHIVLLLALVCQGVRVLALLVVHLLCQCLHPRHMLGLCVIQVFAGRSSV